MKQIAKITEITPKESKCIITSSDRKLFKVNNTNTTIAHNANNPPMATQNKNTHANIKTNNSAFTSHNSVLQRSIIFSCILRPESWFFVGIDLKKVELTPYVAYSNVVLGVATTLENALEVLRFAQQTMMSRYEMMTQLGIKNFLDLPEKGRALMVMIDEYGEAASPTGSKTEEGKAADEMKGEIQMLVGSIARLGRAAGVHLVVATQRPDAKMLPGETKEVFVNTPIFTTQGWKTMGEIKIGDSVFDEKGDTASVINMTDFMYGHKTYKIKFSTGESIIAGETHRWPIYKARARLDYKDTIEHHVRYPHHAELLKSLEKIDIDVNELMSLREIEKTINNGDRVHILRRLINEEKIQRVKVVAGEQGRFDVSYFSTLEVIEKMTERLTKKFGKTGKNDSKLMTTQEIFDNFKNLGDRRYATDVTKPLKMEEKELSIDPWLLGFWLGDGSSYDGTIATADKCLIPKIEKLGYKVKSYNAKYVYGINGGFTTELRNLNLIKNKHIPNDYLMGSIEQRRELLAGLLDSDGSAARKQVSFVNTNKNLAEGVLFLARSLGYKASMSFYKQKEDTQPNSVCFGITGKDYWRIVFTPNEQVFGLTRKQKMLGLDDNDRKTINYHYIDSIEEVETVPTKCIEVDNASHTYLAGKSLIPTHNSNLGARINCGYAPPLTSSMILDNAEGTKVKANPKGRFYIRIYSNGNHGQAFFAKEDWMDNYLDAQGLEQDGTPKGSTTSANAIEEAANAEGGASLNLKSNEDGGNQYARPEDDWDDDLDELISENSN